jgi:hypothetical protein
MSEKTVGEHTNITINAEADGMEKLNKSLPVIGSAVSSVDGALSLDARAFVTNTATFVESCASTVTGMMTDPLTTLTDAGLGFLLAVFPPLQDALHFVSGDGPALSNAAGNFTNIGKGLERFAEELTTEEGKRLDRWTSPAASTARDRIAEFSGGVQGVASVCGEISGWLQACSMLMTVIEEVIRSMISELVIWLLWIWPPALAASGPTLGGSVVEASGLTWYKAGETTVRATRKLKDAGDLLSMAKAVLGRAGETLAKQVTNPLKAGKNAVEMAKGAEAYGIGSPSEAEKASSSLDV